MTSSVSGTSMSNTSTHSHFGETDVLFFRSYVPIKSDYADLTDAAAFFIGAPDGTGSHDDLAKKIAENGKKYAKEHWREADMCVCRWGFSRCFSPVADSRGPLPPTLRAAYQFRLCTGISSELFLCGVLISCLFCFTCRSRVCASHLAGAGGIARLYPGHLRRDLRRGLDCLELNVSVLERTSSWAWASWAQEDLL